MLLIYEMIWWLGIIVQHSSIQGYNLDFSGLIKSTMTGDFLIHKCIRPSVSPSYYTSCVVSWTYAPSNTCTFLFCKKMMIAKHNIEKLQIWGNLAITFVLCGQTQHKKFKG